MKNLLKIGLILALVLQAGCHRSDNTNELFDNARTATNNTQNTTNQHSSTAQNPKKSNKPYVLGLPVHIKPLNVMIYPILPILSQSKSSYDKVVEFSGKSRKYLAAGQFTVESPYSYNTNAFNLEFQVIQANSNQPEAANSIKTQKHKLFDHNKFTINTVFYPHIITKKAIFCKKADRFQKHCIQHQFIENNQPETDNKYQEYDAIKEDIVRTETFNRFIYKVKDSNFTKEQILAINEKKGNLHTSQSLYISDGLGRNVTKLHPNNQYIEDVQWMPELKHYYFTTIEDSNNNQSIEMTDKQYMYLIDFNMPNPSAVLINTAN